MMAPDVRSSDSVRFSFLLVVGLLLLVGCDTRSALVGHEGAAAEAKQSSASERADVTTKVPPPGPPPAPGLSKILSVEVDIKPGDEPNAINPSSRGVTPVAILNTDAFDPVAQADVSTLRFGAPDVVDDGGAAPAHGGHAEDVDGDGDEDLVLHFPTPDAGFEEGEQTGRVLGDTRQGMPIRGRDSVTIVGGDPPGTSPVRVPGPPRPTPPSPGPPHPLPFGP